VGAQQTSFLPDARPAAECPACEQPATFVAQRNRRVEYKCSNDDCGLPFELMTPRDWGESRNLTPYQTRQRIKGRSPWHHGGKPAVAWPKRAENLGKSGGQPLADRRELDRILTSTPKEKAQTAANGLGLVSGRESVARVGGAMPATTGHHE
jgi:hypothetical protein